MDIAGRLFVTLIGLFILWLAVTMAISPALIVPVPGHGDAPERVVFERTAVTEIARYLTAALLGFFGLTLTLAPWRRKTPRSGSAERKTGDWG